VSVGFGWGEVRVGSGGGDIATEEKRLAAGIWRLAEALEAGIWGGSRGRHCM